MNKKLLLKLSDIKDFKNMHWRHIVQSMLVFACFCTVDTYAEKFNTVWLISAALIVIAIFVLMLAAGKIEIGKWSNILNIIAAGMCVGSYFVYQLYPAALFFITLTAGIRIIHARQRLNDYSTTVFIIASVFFGIIIRFALVLLPMWSMGIIMVLTIFNPIIRREDMISGKEETYSGADGNKDDISGEKVLAGEKVSDDISLALQDDKQIKKDRVIAHLAAVLLFVYLLCVEVFGGPLTDAVSSGFPMELVNVAYILGYLLFIAAILVLRLKFVSVVVMFLSVTAMFFFLIPPTSTFGIYFLLFMGGGIKVLMLASPVTFFRGKYKYFGALGGVFIYRSAFLLSGTVEALAGDSWDISSGLTYSLAAIVIVLGVTLIFLISYWDRHEIRMAAAKTVLVLPQKTVYNLPPQLSHREREISQLIFDGKSADEIAEELFISVSTVRTHIKNILRKCDCNSQMVFIARYGKDSR